MNKTATADFYWYTLPVIISAYLAYAAGVLVAVAAAAAGLAAVAAVKAHDHKIRRLALAAFLAALAGIPGISIVKMEKDKLFAGIASAPEVQDILVTIADSECSPASRYLAPPSYMRARIDTGNREFYAYVRAGKKDIWQITPGWGDTFRVTGLLKVPDSPAKQPSLAVDKAELVSHGSGPFRKLLDMRDKIMDHVTGGFGDTPDAVRARGVVAALIFGCCQGVSREVMDDFVLTGTIHILSVSGLHIGVLAIAVSVLLMLAGVRLRTRCFLAPALLLPYLVMTGCSIPAMRSWLMFTAWSLCRCFLLRTPPVRILVLLAAATAVLAPADLLNMGFQYSFAVTAALLLLIPLLKELHVLLEANRRWMLPYRIVEKYSLRMDKLRRGTINALLAAVVAFAAGMPLTLFYHGKVAMIAVFLNVLISPLLPLAYAGALVAVLLPFAWSSKICLWTVDLMLTIIDTAGNIALVPSGFGTPDRLLCAIGTAGVLMMLASGAGRMLRKPGLVMFLIFIAGCFIKPLFMEPGILVLVPAYKGEPSIAACHPAFYSRKGIFIAGNLDSECRIAAEKFFFEKGITELQSLVIPVNSNGTWYQLQRLAAAIPVKSIEIRENMRKSSAALSAVAAIAPAAISKSTAPEGDFFGHTLRVRKSGNYYHILLDGSSVAAVSGVSNHMREIFVPLPQLRIP